MLSTEVYCAAHPARFHTICSGELVIRTDSGADDLAHAIAKALAEGMMGVETGWRVEGGS